MEIIKRNNISRDPPQIQPLHKISNSQTCPRCGSALKEQRKPGQEYLLDADSNNESADKPRQVVFARYSLLAILAVVIGVFALSWRNGSDEVSEPQESPPSLEPVQLPQQLLQEGDVLTVEADILANQRVPTDFLIDFSVALGPFRLAYLSEDGITVVDLNAMPTLADLIIFAQDGDPYVNPTEIASAILRQYSPVPASMLDLFAGFESWSMFVPGWGTYGFELTGGSEEFTVYRFSSQGHVIIGADNSIAMAASSIGDHIAVYVGNPSGVFLRRVDVPAGARLIEVPNLGILIVSATGETFVTKQNGFHNFSDWPVWAATSTHHVEIRCQTSFECTPVLVDRVTVDEEVLPVELVNELREVTISPNGKFLFLTKTDQSGQVSNLLYKVESGEVVNLAISANTEVAWAPDSSAVSWFDYSTKQPVIRILDTARVQVESFDLSRLGAPSREGESLMLLP